MGKNRGNKYRQQTENNENNPLKNRSFLALTAAKRNPKYAIRTDQWKAIIHGSRHHELYDTYSDPMEKNNLVHKNNALFAGLVELLANSIYQTRSEALFAEEGDQPSEDDLNMLRELGYLE